MQPSYSYYRNLRLPESGISFIINYFLTKCKIANTLSPINFETTCNNILLDIIDTSNTKGKVTYIPIAFLLDFYTKTTKLEYNLSKDEVEDKKKLLNFFKDNNGYKNIKESLEQYKFRNISLEYFKKPTLSCLLSKTSDYSRNLKILDEFSKKYGIIGFNTKNLISTSDLNEETVLEWMNNNEIYNLLYPITLLFEDIFIIPLTNIPVVSYNEQLTYSGFYQSQIKYFWDTCLDVVKNKKNIRFIISPIIYNSHFTALIIDLNSPIPKDKNKKDKTKIAYFFNSGGYDPFSIEKNENYWFLNSSMEIYNHTKRHGKITMENCMPITILTSYLLKKFNITNFIFNDFELQHGNSECGIFCTFFLLCFLLLRNKNNYIEIIDFKQIYFSFLAMGDLIMSYYRGLLYTTDEDLEKNKITFNKYMNSYNVYPIQNRKFIEFSQSLLKIVKFF